MLKEMWADEELPDEFWATLPATHGQKVIKSDAEQLKSELQDYEVGLKQLGVSKRILT